MERQTEADRLKSLMRAGMLPVEAVQNCAKLGHEPSLELFPRTKIYWALFDVRLRFLSTLSQNTLSEFAFRCALQVVSDHPERFHSSDTLTMSFSYPRMTQFAWEQLFPDSPDNLPDLIDPYTASNMLRSTLVVPLEEYHFSRAMRAMAAAWSGVDHRIPEFSAGKALAACEASDNAFFADSKKASYEWQQAILAQLILKPYL